MAEEADDEEDSGVPVSAPAAGATPATPASPAPAATGAAPAAPASPALDGLVVTPGQMERTRQRLLEIQNAKMANTQANADEMTARLDKDRARLEQAYKASAAEPAGLEPWDAQKKAAEHNTDPVQAFGSVGSVFAMLASSFAGLPMEAGLNAGAAAINAVHAGDEKAYQREYDAWKSNTDLALKRHELQRQAYNDALTLMNSNINAGRTKMELAATKFGDQKVQALLENGMDKELTDLFVSRNKAATEMQDQWDKVQLQHEKVMDLRSDPRFTSNSPELKAQAITEWNQRWAANGGQKLKYDETADYIAAQKRANPNWTPEDLKKWMTDAAEAKDAGGGTGGGPLSGPKARQLEVDRRKAQYISDGMSETDAYNKAVREVELARNVPSGNRIDDLHGKVDQAKNIIAGAEKNLDFLRTYKGGAGLAGKLMRGEEIAENITGISDKTDRTQFRRRVLEMQEIVPRILTDSNGRPLKSAQDKIDGIVAGLNAGDTGPNTTRAYSELVDEMKHRIQDYEARIKGSPSSGTGSFNPEGVGGGASGSSGSTKSSTGKMPWQKDPIVKPAEGGAGPRVDAGDEAAYV